MFGAPCRRDRARVGSNGFIDAAARNCDLAGRARSLHNQIAGRPRPAIAAAGSRKWAPACLAAFRKGRSGPSWRAACGACLLRPAKGPLWRFIFAQTASLSERCWPASSFNIHEIFSPSRPPLAGARERKQISSARGSPAGQPASPTAQRPNGLHDGRARAGRAQVSSLIMSRTSAAGRVWTRFGQPAFENNLQDCRSGRRLR